MASVIVPNIDAPIAGPGGQTTRAWYAYFQSLRMAAGDAASQAAIDGILARLAALEDESAVDFQLLGVASVRTQGSVAGGMVQLTLAGDENEPGPTYFYGTNSAGEKGWHLLGDSFDTTTLAKVTDPATGIVSFDLAELPDTGIGAALVKLTRDGYGRVEGTEAAVLDDLSDVDAADPTAGDALVFDGTNWAPGQVATEQLFQRMTPEADFRITADGNLRVTT